MNAKRNSEQAIKRRVRAGRLLLAGKSPAEVARLVGAPRQTVYRWREVLDASGIDALRNMSTGAAARTWRSGIVAAICDAARGWPLAVAGGAPSATRQIKTRFSSQPPHAGADAH